MNRRRGALLVLGLIVIVSGWWVLNGNSLAQRSEGVVDVWATWGDKPAQLQTLLDRYSSSSGVPVRVVTRARSDDLLEALAGDEPPDLVVVSNVDLVASYAEQDLVEPLYHWTQATGIDLDDIYPAPLGQCKGSGGEYLCLPWGCDVDALFWNKDLFKVAGLDPERPPRTMEELVEYANRLTLRNDAGDLRQVGFVPDFPVSHTELFVRMFGAALYNNEGTELTINSQAMVDALNWENEFYNIYTQDDLKDLISSFTPYQSSSHPRYGGRGLDCRQCHRASPIQNNKTPDVGFYEGRVAMMIDGQWQVGPNALSRTEVSYGVAPLPSPSAHPEKANTSVVRGPVVFIPKGAVDKEAAAGLLAWMMSPEVVTEAAHAIGALPTSRTAAQDPRFQQIAEFKVFMDLLSHPNAASARTTPISQALNEALVQAEQQVLDNGADPRSVLNKIQAEFEPKLGRR